MKWLARWLRSRRGGASPESPAAARRRALGPAPPDDAPSTAHWEFDHREHVSLGGADEWHRLAQDALARVVANSQIAGPEVSFRAWLSLRFGGADVAGARLLEDVRSIAEQLEARERAPDPHPGARDLRRMGYVASSRGDRALCAHLAISIGGRPETEWCGRAIRAYQSASETYGEYLSSAVAAEAARSEPPDEEEEGFVEYVSDLLASCEIAKRRFAVEGVGELRALELASIVGFAPSGLNAMELKAYDDLARGAAVTEMAQRLDRILDARTDVRRLKRGEDSTVPPVGFYLGGVHLAFVVDVLVHGELDPQRALERYFGHARGSAG